MPTVQGAHEFTAYASHMSVFLCDSEQISDVDYGAWADHDVDRRRVLASRFELQVATPRYDDVPIALRVLASPTDMNKTATHVVECDLEVPSGLLHVRSVADDEPAAEIPVEPGRCRVRISYVPRAQPYPGAHEDVPGDHLDYVIDLWPSRDSRAPATLIQGDAVWAG